MISSLSSLAKEPAMLKTLLISSMLVAAGAAAAEPATFAIDPGT